MSFVLLENYENEIVIFPLSCLFRSPSQNCDHGYLSGLGAQKLDTIFRHYYPESGFGWIIFAVAILIAIISHGFQLSAIFFLMPALKRFQVSDVECLGEYNSNYILTTVASAGISVMIFIGISFALNVFSSA